MNGVAATYTERSVSPAIARLTAVALFADKRAACWSKGRHHEGAPDSAQRARCPRADRHSPLPGGFGHQTWPEVEKPRPINLGQSRGGAPKGERVPLNARTRPKREQVATSDRVARPHETVAPFRRSASLHFFEAKEFVALVDKPRAHMRRENESARTIRPREAGEGDHWSSRSERTVVEGAPEPERRCRCKRFSA
jgi:hypothetical protein